ncbi:MAG: hypothetical protein QOJ70_363 [Acidobacteriota bacterium]|jgi:hypothetical protein|nr:hypothetical protein [Acidobacteriota bacterium]
MAHGKRKRDSIHETPDVSYITNPDVAHEESDVAVRPLLWFVGGLTFFTIVVCGAMLLMFTYFLNREKSQELEASPLARQGEERLPPEPRLQLAPGWNVKTDDGQKHDLSYQANVEHVPQPWSEYLLVTDEWRREMEDYGWANQQAGTVRVPVEQAMRVYLQRRQAGQQQQGAQPPTPNAGAGAQQPPKETTPSDSSSGQQPEQKHQ